MSKSVSLEFHGAAGSVSGSCFELRSADRCVIIDCGLFEGTRTLEALNRGSFGFDPASVNAVILTHARLDHSGRLPLLARHGLCAPLWCSQPTADMLAPLLRGNAEILKADATRRNARDDRLDRPPFVPLYTEEDVGACLAAIVVAPLCEWIDLGAGWGFRLWNSLHITGSTSVELMIDDLRILFSGNVGEGSAVLCAGAELGGFDHVICETTFGDSVREPILLSDRREQLARHVETTLRDDGNLVIPSEALEQTQAVLEDLADLIDSGRIPILPILVDQPYSAEMAAAILLHRDPALNLLLRPNVQFDCAAAGSAAQSDVYGAIILAASRNCQTGPIRRHLIQNLPRPQSRILFVNNQVAGSLGERLLSRPEEVRISGHDVRVVADIVTLDAYETHADRAALLQWICTRAPVSGSIFLVHGDKAALATLALDITHHPDLCQPIVPALGDIWQLGAAKPATRLHTA